MDFERLQKIITIRPELHKATLKEIKKMSKIIFYILLLKLYCNM